MGQVLRLAPCSGARAGQAHVLALIAVCGYLVSARAIAITHSEQPVAVVAAYDGIIHPIAAEFFDEVISRADTSSAAVAVVVLRTPGGLLDSTRAIVSRMISARMTRRQEFLSAIAHPQIAYLLLTLGMLGLTVDLWNPGAVVPGVVGGLFLLLAFFAFQVLPVDTIGLLLIVFGVALLLLEVKLPSFGALGIGGATTLVAGSVMLTDDLPGVEVSYQIVVPVALALAGILLVLSRLAVTALRMRPVTGADGLIGAHGRTLTDITPDVGGQINLHGEIWRAASRVPLSAGREVRVTALSGLTVSVEPLNASVGRGETT